MGKAYLIPADDIKENPFEERHYSALVNKRKTKLNRYSM